MKRKLIGLLCVCMLLSGCETGSAKPLQTEVPATKEPVMESAPVVSDLPLLEQGITLAESSNLRYIPNGEVESMSAPEMRLLGNGLLLSCYSENALILKHISLENGSVVTSASVSAQPGAKLYIGSGEIGICDSESGLISILDESFQVMRTYDIPQEGDEWYLNSELDTLYIFISDRGLLVRKLETGETFWLVDNGFGVSCKGGGSGYVIFEYTDRGNQKTCTRCLNLSTASLETLPVDGSVTSATRHGENWLIQSREDIDRYMLVGGEAVQSFEWTDSAVRLLSPRRHLLVTDPSGRNLMLYDTDGVFLSQCSLPQNSNALVGSDFVWSGYWQGYFFIDYIDASYRLMFWDVNAYMDGENLPMSQAEAVQQTQSVVDSSLYQRAAQLSQRFGVDIRIAEQCSLEYSHYDTYPMTDATFIRSALDVLEDSLNRYPDGFFQQLRFGSIESIRLELVGGLTAKDNVHTHPDSIGAFAQDRGSHYLIVLDGYLLQQQTLFHEFSHIIDAKLEWDASIREDALYSEERWMELQPAGFQYALTYTEIPEELLSYMDSGYFITDYAMTFPAEDRAVLMASAMGGYSWDFEPDTGRSAKLQYYADCIRDCFDTTGWPEITAWEQVLK